jgi:hypothetical protein
VFEARSHSVLEVIVGVAYRQVIAIEEYLYTLSELSLAKPTGGNRSTVDRLQLTTEIRVYLVKTDPLHIFL